MLLVRLINTFRAWAPTTPIALSANKTAPEEVAACVGYNLDHLAGFAKILQCTNQIASLCGVPMVDLSERPRVAMLLFVSVTVFKVATTLGNYLLPVLADFLRIVFVLFYLRTIKKENNMHVIASGPAAFDTPNRGNQMFE